MRLPENFEKKMRDLLKEDFDDYKMCIRDRSRTCDSESTDLWTVITHENR